MPLAAQCDDAVIPKLRSRRGSRGTFEQAESLLLSDLVRVAITHAAAAAAADTSDNALLVHNDLLLPQPAYK